MSPRGREVFRQAVEAEKRLIRERGYVEFKDDNGRMQRIYVDRAKSRPAEDAA
jgi:hypothetical protein